MFSSLRPQRGAGFGERLSPENLPLTDSWSKRQKLWFRAQSPRRRAQSLSSVPFLRLISCYLPRTLPLPSLHQHFVLPKTPQVVSSQPYAGDCRGAAALRLLHVLQYSVHPTLEQLWSKRVPALVEHIEGRRGLQPLLGLAASRERSGVLPPCRGTWRAEVP